MINHFDEKNKIRLILMIINEETEEKIATIESFDADSLVDKLYSFERWHRKLENS